MEYGITCALARGLPQSLLAFLMIYLFPLIMKRTGKRILLCSARLMVSGICFSQPVVLPAFSLDRLVISPLQQTMTETERQTLPSIETASGISNARN